MTFAPKFDLVKVQVAEDNVGIFDIRIHAALSLLSQMEVSADDRIWRSNRPVCLLCLSSLRGEIPARSL
jgi:hypothetical protein